MCGGTSSLGDTLPGRSGGGRSGSSLQAAAVAAATAADVWWSEKTVPSALLIRSFLWPRGAWHGPARRAHFLVRLSSSDRPLRACETTSRPIGRLLRMLRRCSNRRAGPSRAALQQGAAASIIMAWNLLELVSTGQLPWQNRPSQLHMQRAAETQQGRIPASRGEQCVT